jgi:hypothetical protein
VIQRLAVCDHFPRLPSWAGRNPLNASKERPCELKARSFIDRRIMSSFFARKLFLSSLIVRKLISSGSVIQP